MKNSATLALFAGALLVMLSACSRESAQEEAKTGGQTTYLTVKGSDTMVHLVSTWAEEYMKTHSGMEVSVTGGGSGTGIAALINGTTDICAASREMKESERARIAQGGSQAVETVVARDGIALVVNPHNPVEELTIEQLRKIYTGAYTQWSQVGGPAQDIIVLSRESSSGTYVFFQEHVLNKEDYAQTARLMPATSAIIQAVTTDRWAIGYVGIGYAVEAGERVKIVRVKADASSPAVTPSDATVKSGEYSIARPLYLYTKGAPTGAAKGFVDFCLSAEGQRIVRETGYVPIN